MNNYNELMNKFVQALPKFPDGRIDYSSSDTAPVITVFVKYQNKILLMKRSERVKTYQGKWMTVAGYLDSPNQSLADKIYEELREETGIDLGLAASLKFGETFTFVDKAINKTWITHPAIVELVRKPEITLDREHTEYRWIKSEGLDQYDTVPTLLQSWKNVNNKTI